MSFDSDERSAYGSRPVYLFAFTGPGATYYYTTAEVAITYGGHTYAPQPTMLTNLEVARVVDPADIKITAPLDLQFVLDHAFGMPGQGLTVVIRRYQRTSALAITVHTASVAAIGIVGRDAEIRVPSGMDDALSTAIPGVLFHRTCPHVLYDTMCTIDPASFDLATTLVTVASRAIEVASIGGNPDQWFRGGYVIRGADSDRRTIVDQVGTTITLNAPFRSAAASDAVTLYAGCDRSVTTCKSKFSNVANFGGFAYIDASDSPVMLQNPAL